MKAVQINSYGGPEVLELNEVHFIDHVAHKTTPDVPSGKLWIEVNAAGLNPIDWKIRRGYLKERVPLKFPVTLGTDLSGVVMEVGKNVSDLKKGDEVYGNASILNGGTGSFAGFVIVDAIRVSKKPNNVNFIEAGALPLAGMSAIQALEDHIKLKSGQKILIHGGAGGIGHIAIQIAKSLDAYVATTVSEKDREFVKELGADVVIDYKNENFEDMIKDYDAVFDLVGGDISDRSFNTIKKGGIIISMVGQPSLELAEKYGVTAIGQGTNSNSEYLNKLSELVEAGKIKVNVDKIFPLEQVREAFAYMEEGHPQGKVVLKIK